MVFCFFQTPRIVEATTDRQRLFDMPTSTDIVKEGMLSCKMAISDGKVRLEMKKVTQSCHQGIVCNVLRQIRLK